MKKGAKPQATRTDGLETHRKTVCRNPQSRNFRCVYKNKEENL